MAEPVSPPTLRLLANEVLGFPKVLASPFRRPDKPEQFGQGRPVMVIPGMMSDDRATALLVRTLRNAGFAAHGWENGLNLRVNPQNIARTVQRLQRSATENGQPVILIGWSLGGLYARLLAHRYPSSVEMVMTLGSPFSGDRRGNNAWRIYELLNEHTVDDPPFDEDLSVKPPVKTIAMWSAREGIIAPECARGNPDESDHQIELPVRHLEMTSSRRAVRHIVETLRQLG